jgi:hypothetical protein
MSSEELEDMEDHAFDMAFGKTLEELNEQEILLSEAAPALSQIAKEYNLKLGVLSDFKIARAIWAKSLKQYHYNDYCGPNGSIGV